MLLVIKTVFAEIKYHGFQFRSEIGNKYYKAHFNTDINTWRLLVTSNYCLTLEKVPLYK